MILTLCGLTSQKTHRGGLGLGGSVHEEAHPFNHPLKTLMLEASTSGPADFEKILTAVPCAPKLN